MTGRTFLEVDGHPEPIERLRWIEVAPCGCWPAVSRAEYGGPGGGPCLTAEQARLLFSGSARAARRDEERGHSVRLITSDYWGSHSGEKFIDCPHNPKWGLAPRLEPEGHKWAGHRGSRSLHLVPSVALDQKAPWTVRMVPSLCAVEKHIWDEAWSFPGYLECARCQKAATRLADTA